MPVTIPQVAVARPDGLTAAGSELSRAAATLAEQIDQQRAASGMLDVGWQGTGFEAAVAKSAPTLEQLTRMYEAMSRLQTALLDGGPELATRRSAVIDVVGRLCRQGWRVTPQGGVTVRPGSPLDRLARRDPVSAVRVQQLAAANGAILKTALAGFDTADRGVAMVMGEATAGLYGQVRQFWGAEMPLPQSPPPNLGPTIPEAADPVEVRSWWAGLSPEDRERVIRERPGQLGNLDGVPVWARSRANIAVMHRDIDRVEQRAAVLGATVDQLTDDPKRFGLNTTEVTRYANAVQVRAGLDENSKKTRGVPTFLYVYDPEVFDGQGRAAVAIGNPDEALNTAVVVPGTGNSVTSGWLGNGDAAHVYNETTAADPTRRTAVVAWMGYDAPDSLGDVQVGQVGNARVGGNLLANDINALETTNVADSHVTMIGHSYGATTVADACAGFGLRADNVVLTGCPGTDLAGSAVDLNLPPGGQVFVGAASTDPVTQFGHVPQVHIPATGVTVSLGEDPAMADFGATRIKAEVVGWDDEMQHSGYLRPGSEALFAIADIASGHSDLLDDHDMLAWRRDHLFPRIPGLPNPVIDPELVRPATGGHHH